MSEMSERVEIKVEQQAGGWIWVAVSTDPHGGDAAILRCSQEAFATREEALANAGHTIRASAFPTDLRSDKRTA